MIWLFLLRLCDSLFSIYLCAVCALWARSFRVSIKLLQHVCNRAETSNNHCRSFFCWVHDSARFSMRTNRVPPPPSPLAFVGTGCFSHEHILFLRYNNIKIPRIIPVIWHIEREMRNDILSGHEMVKWGDRGGAIVESRTLSVFERGRSEPA